MAGNAIVVQNKDPRSQTRILVATLIAAAGLAVAEAGFPRVAVAFAWLTLAGVLLVRVDPATPAPVESFEQWYRGVK